jgi:hypothetical protein
VFGMNIINVHFAEEPLGYLLALKKVSDKSYSEVIRNGVLALDDYVSNVSRGHILCAGKPVKYNLLTGLLQGYSLFPERNLTSFIEGEALGETRVFPVEFHDEERETVEKLTKVPIRGMKLRGVLRSSVVFLYTLVHHNRNGEDFKYKKNAKNGIIVTPFYPHHLM